MGQDTKIQWAHHTWNPWRGCSHALLSDGSQHPGCLNCYAERGAKRNPTVLGIWGENGSRVMAAPQTFGAPIRWNAEAEAAGERRRVFVDSWSDFFEENDAPVVDHHGERIKLGLNVPVALKNLRESALGIMHRCQWLDFMILTKRPQNSRRMLCETNPTGRYLTSPRGSCGPAWYRENVWLLASVSDQKSADEMIPHLLTCRDLVPVVGISAEPLVGPLDLSEYLEDDHDQMLPPGRAIGLVIAGGESGPRARPCVVEDIWNLVLQCRNAGVACFVKQLGSHVVTSNVNCLEWPEGVNFAETDHMEGAASGRIMLNDSKGGDPDEWPEELRVREFPETKVSQ